MSDEYASSGYKGSLVNPSLNEVPDKTQQVSNRISSGTPGKQQNKGNFDYETHNYPSPGDSTAEGGYGSVANVWSGRSQRGNQSGTGSYKDGIQIDAGLTDQGKDGEPLRDQFDDSRSAC